MTRRHGVEIAVLGLLAATVVILFLNLFEVDEYPEGIDAASTAPGDLPSWLPLVLHHPCETCKSCPHRFETAECRLRVTVRDHDGWYRLFWAGDDTYTYDDPAFLAGALRNKTSELVEGTWTIRGHYSPAEKHDPHACPPAATGVDLKYRLRRGSFPGPGDPVIDPSGTLVVPGRLLWFRFPFPPDRVDDFWWELENPDSFGGTKASDCPCGQK